MDSERVVMNEYQNQQYSIEQQQTRTLSNRSYNVLIGGHLIYGILLTAVFYAVVGNRMLGVFAAHPFVFLLLFLGVTFSGSRLMSVTNYAVSLLGYTIVVFGFGAMLATMLPLYAAPVILTAARLTLAVLAVMTLAAIFFPAAFLSLGRTLFVSLIGLIIAEIAASLLGFYNYGLFGVIGLFLFSLYIGYDWAKGQRLPHTAGCAVYTAMSLYMDIVNIFVRILSLTGRRR